MEARFLRNMLVSFCFFSLILTSSLSYVGADPFTHLAVFNNGNYIASAEFRFGDISYSGISPGVETQLCVVDSSYLLSCIGFTDIIDRFGHGHGSIDEDSHYDQMRPESADVGDDDANADDKNDDIKVKEEKEEKEKEDENKDQLVVNTVADGDKVIEDSGLFQKRRLHPHAPPNFQGCWAIKGISFGFGCFTRDRHFNYNAPVPTDTKLCLVRYNLLFACTDLIKISQKAAGPYFDVGTLASGTRRLGSGAAGEERRQKQLNIVEEISNKVSEVLNPNGNFHPNTVDTLWYACVFTLGNFTNRCLRLRNASPQKILPKTGFTGLYYTSSNEIEAQYFVVATATVAGYEIAIENLMSYVKNGLVNATGVAGLLNLNSLLQLFSNDEFTVDPSSLGG